MNPGRTRGLSAGDFFAPHHNTPPFGFPISGASYKDHIAIGRHSNTGSHSHQACRWIDGTDISIEAPLK